MDWCADNGYATNWALGVSRGIESPTQYYHPSRVVNSTTYQHHDYQNIHQSQHCNLCSCHVYWNTLHCGSIRQRCCWTMQNACMASRSSYTLYPYGLVYIQWLCN
jgi:hypothetical protein